MSRWSDIAAMRAAIESIERLEKQPAELRPFFMRSDAAIELAISVAHAGGRLPIPANAGPEWIDLLSSGHLHFGFGPLRGWVEIDPVLMAEFLGRAAA